MNVRDRGYYREQRIRNINKRKNKIKHNTPPWWRWKTVEDDDFVPGKIHKGHYGYLGSGGTNVKTNTRKGHASYRHKGAYGKADNYKRHDYQQVERMNIEEDEYKKGELE